MSHMLTQRQRDVVEAIRSFTARAGYAPSYRDIGDALGGMSTNAVSDHLEALEKKGVIRRTPGVPRSIVVIDPPVAAIGAQNAWAAPRGLTSRGTALVLLAAAVAACGRRARSTVLLVAQLAEAPSLLADRIGGVRGAQLLAACGRDLGPVSDQEWARAQAHLVSLGVVLASDDDTLAPGPAIATMTDRAWARERARFAAHCFDTMPELGVLLVRGAA